VDSAIRLVADYALYAVALGAVLTWLRVPRTEKVPLAVAAVVAVLLVAVGVKVAGMVWTDPRPFVVDHTTPLIPHPADNGFPSDHTALATAVAAVVLLWHRRAGAALLVLAVLIGAARVGAHVHHWPDIIAALGIGVVCAGLGGLAARSAVPWVSRVRTAQRPTV
jgi:undecaprenyl-diphosphatase